VTALDWLPGGGALFRDLPDGVAAGFTTRGLVSDDMDADAGARELAILLGGPAAPVARLKQVHGAGVVEARDLPSGTVAVAGYADALVTTERGLVLAIATADCVPVVLLDAEAGVLAALHAGWRGTAARVLDAALDAVLERGGNVERLVALFGPSVSRDAYEVGPEVITFLGGSLPPGAAVPGRGDRTFLDVAACNEAALRRRGVAAERIVRPPLCTYGDPERFTSYRREGAHAGRIFTGGWLLPDPGGSKRA
jgi:YfiH family protein